MKFVRHTIAKLMERSIELLEPWPTYSEYFLPATDEEIQALADDIAANGLIQPIEIAPDGRILDGHTRLAALQHLGRETARVYVRYDLRDDEQALSRRFLVANLERKGLSPLTIARLLNHAKELLPSNRAAKGDGALRDRVAARFNLSGRNLARYESCLALPFSLQRLIETNAITLTAGQRLLDLDPEALNHIESTIAAGAKPKVAIAEYSPPKPLPNTAEKLTNAMHRVLTLLGQLQPADRKQLRTSESYSELANQIINELGRTKSKPNPK